MVSPVLSLLTELLRRPSVTPDDAGCQKIVGDRLQAAGFSVEHLRFGSVDNLWATHGHGSPLICLAGHTDVVPPGPLSAWNHDPFEPVEIDGFIYGRGASDMKGSDAAMTVALERVAHAGHIGTIALLLTSDEEGRGIDGTDRVLRRLIERGVQIDAAIVGEPTSEREFGDVCKIGRRGSVTGTVRVSGVQGHTAYPQIARNAVHRAVPVLEKLINLHWGEATNEFPATTLQISNMNAGTGAPNVIPGSCELQFNLRFGRSWTLSAIQERITELFLAEGIDDEIQWESNALPFITQPGPLVDALEAAVFEVLGKKPLRTAGGGTSDARFFAAHGIPVAEFGPLNATIHAANERIEIECLEPLANVYETIVQRFLAVRAGA